VPEDEGDPMRVETPASGVTTVGAATSPVIGTAAMDPYVAEMRARRTT
jgi:hypothetical protein